MTFSDFRKCPANFGIMTTLSVFTSYRTGSVTFFENVKHFEKKFWGQAGVCYANDFRYDVNLKRILVATATMTERTRKPIENSLTTISVCVVMVSFMFSVLS